AVVIRLNRALHVDPRTLQRLAHAFGINQIIKTVVAAYVLTDRALRVSKYEHLAVHQLDTGRRAAACRVKIRVGANLVGPHTFQLAKAKRNTERRRAVGKT